MRREVGYSPLKSAISRRRRIEASLHTNTVVKPSSINLANIKAQVDLRFRQDASGRTFAARRFVTYPFFLTTPFYLDSTPSGMLTTILQSVSGGIYEGEQLALTFTAEVDAQVHCTTQSATVVHSMSNASVASQAVAIHAATGSFVEYLPDPLVLFPMANLRTSIHVVAEEDATVIVTDAFLSHDPNSQGRTFHTLFSETSLRRPDGRLVCLDRFAIAGDALVFPAPGMMQGFTAQGTLWAFCTHGDQLLAPLREAVAHIPGLYAGVSLLPNNAGVWTRFLAADAVVMQRVLQAAWAAVRRTLTGTAPASRRKSGGS
jgi:urease accessory protein